MHGTHTQTTNVAGSAISPKVTVTLPEISTEAGKLADLHDTTLASELNKTELHKEDAPEMETLQTEAPKSKTSETQPPESENSQKGSNQKSESRNVPIKRILITTLLTGLLIAGGLSGYQAFNHFMSHQETDDAYTTGHQHQISSRINGTVEQVLVDDNEHVKKGQVLAILDPRDFEVREMQARASLELAQHQAEAAKTSVVLASTTATGKSTEAEAGVSNSEAELRRAEAALLEAKAAVPKAEAELRAREAEETRAKADGKRFVVLANQGAVSFQERDSAIRDFEVAKSSREAAQENLNQMNFKLQGAIQAVKSAKAQIDQAKGLVEQAKATHVQTTVNQKNFDVAKASIHHAEAELRDAQLQLSYTKIVSPVDGRVGRKTVEPGQRIQPGQQLMTIVSDDIWVVANFKETQLERMRPHQLVEIKIDSYPHHEFVGTVDSVSPGSGASFALLPPDNATGNFTKIVQRVPVKIRFDKETTKGYEKLLVPGMSAVVSVDVNEKAPDTSALANHKTSSLRFNDHDRIDSVTKHVAHKKG